MPRPNNMITGSYYYDKYEYYQSTGTVLNLPEIYIAKDVNHERLLICESCETEYLLNFGKDNLLIALRCSQCGGKLRFKR